MTDLETRLADALRDAGERAPHADDLVAPARARLRRRRRTTAAVVAATVAAVAIPVGIQLADQRTEPEVTTVVPDGWRTESFRDLTLQVPPTWGYGAGTDWCAAGAAAPQVSRPSVPDNQRCTPAYGYGVVFREESLDLFTDETFPDEAYYDTVGTTDARVWIAAESQAQLDSIVASIETNTDADPNGCPIPTTRVFGHTNPASICRYDAGGNLLEQSERLSADQTDALRRALASAPEQTRGRACGGVGREYALVLIDGRKVQVFYDARCPAANGAIINGRRVELTEDILYWVLSPGWSGAVHRDVPLPDPLRTLD